MNYQATWDEIIRSCRDAASKGKPEREDDYSPQALKMALPIYKIYLLAEAFRLDSGSGGIGSLDTLRRHLIKNHHWTLEYVRSLKLEDFLFLFQEELDRARLDLEEMAPVCKWANDWGLADLLERLLDDGKGSNTRPEL